jgi:hypothetical protein
MNEPVFFAVRGDFVVEVLKGFRRHGFNLKARLIRDAVTARQGACVLAAHAEMQQAALLGEMLIDVGDLGHEDIGVFPRDHVARACNAYVDDRVLVLHAPLGYDVEQFRVQWSSIDLEDEIGNPGPNKKRVHELDILL